MCGEQTLQSQTRVKKTEETDSSPDHLLTPGAAGVNCFSLPFEFFIVCLFLCFPRRAVTITQNLSCVRRAFFHPATSPTFFLLNLSYFSFPATGPDWSLMGQMGQITSLLQGLTVKQALTRHTPNLLP